MRLYLDTEFNALGGDLISLALVSEDGREWYETLPLPPFIDSWVNENVIPKLGDKPPLAPPVFRESLGYFLSQFQDIEIIADWPADFQYLSEQLTKYAAVRDFSMPFEYQMTFLKGSPEIQPEAPHNALSDAKALREWHHTKSLLPLSPKDL